MTAEQNIETATQMYQAFGSRDVQAILDRVTDDADWSTDAAIPSAPCYGPRRGKDGVASFFEAIGKTGPVTEFTPLAYASSPPRHPSAPAQPAAASDPQRPHVLRRHHPRTAHPRHASPQRRNRPQNPCRQVSRAPHSRSQHSSQPPGPALIWRRRRRITPQDAFERLMQGHAPRLSRVRRSERVFGVRHMPSVRNISGAVTRCYGCLSRREVSVLAD